MNPPAQQTLTHLSCQTLTHHPVSTLTFSCPPVTDHTNLNTDIVFSINEHLWTLSSDYNDLHPYINVLLLYICICVCIFICICIWKCNGYVCAHAFMQTCANVLCIFIYRYRHRYTFRNIYNMHMDKKQACHFTIWENGVPLEGVMLPPTSACLTRHLHCFQEKPLHHDMVFAIEKQNT